VLMSLHAASILHTNVATDVSIARNVGYDGIELWIPKLTRYLDAGFTLEQLTAMLGPLRVTMLDVLLPLESTEPQARRRLVAECRVMTAAAAQLGCAALQAVALDGFATDDWPTQRHTLIESLTELSDIASAHGVRLAVEPVSFSRFSSIWQAVEVIEAIGSDRVGLVLDTWHLWTAGARLEEVAALDPHLIVCAQISDSSPKCGATWSDDDRTALPGDGIVPLDELIDAISRTGYAGVWSLEILSRRHWEWEPQLLAMELLRRARMLLNTTAVTPDCIDSPRSEDVQLGD
jgi:sugar phosphate isomerase/epimerase